MNSKKQGNSFTAKHLLCGILSVFALEASSQEMKENICEAKHGENCPTMAFSMMQIGFVRQRSDVKGPEVLDTTFSAVPSVRGPSGLSCNAEALLGFNERSPDAGFGSKVNNFMNQLAWAAHRNRTVAFWGHGHFVRTWTSFFETSLPMCENPHSTYRKSFEDDMTSFWSDFVMKDTEYALNLKRVTYNAHYRYTPATSDRINRVLGSYGLPAEYFGVHIRLGDKVQEAKPISIEAYAQAIQNSSDKTASGAQHSTAFLALNQARQAAELIKTFKNSSIRTVWLASLEPRAKHDLRESLGGDYKILSLTESVKDWHSSAAEQYAPGSHALYDVLTDVEALWRSYTFIGTASSNLGRLVYFLRQPGSNSISLDEGFLQRSE